MIEIGREGDKPFRRKPIADVLDVIHQAPPLLNHHHSRTGSLLRNREITTGSAACKWKLGHLSHDRSPTLFPLTIVCDRAARRPSDSLRRGEYQIDRSRAW